MLMSAERARRLGCPRKGIIAGAGISSDARHITAPDRTGAGLIRAVAAAVKTAGIKKEDIAGISAHGTGTIYNDLMELTAFRTVFEKNCPPIYSVKGCLGHTFGAAGGIEVALGTKPYHHKPCRLRWVSFIRKGVRKDWSTLTRFP